MPSCRLAAASSLLNNHHPAERRTFFDGTNGSSGIDRDLHRWESQSLHQGRRSPKIPPSSSSSKSQRHHRKDDEIREIFALIDKVLGGCEDSAEVEARIEELLLRSAGSQGRYFRPDILFLKHDSMILGQSSNPVHCWASRHSLGFEDDDLGSSPSWWAATVATYCPSRPGELSKFLT